jgi:hypothetical protein
MTVIAYSSKHRVLAADSRCAEEGEYHLTNCQKVFVLKSGALFGMAGEADERDFLALLERATPRRMPTRAQIAELHLDGKLILVFPHGQVFRIACEFCERGQSQGEWTGEVLPIRDTLIAVGSGAAYAYGAMEHGASPTQAVRIACKRDLMCALPVQWEALPALPSDAQ